MFFPSDIPGTSIGGPADIMVILKLPSGTFHCALFYENPMPGPIQPVSELEIVRLKSHSHQTIGCATIEEAQAKAQEYRKTVIIRDENVALDDALVVENPVNV